MTRRQRSHHSVTHLHGQGQTSGTLIPVIELHRTLDVDHNIVNVGSNNTTVTYYFLV